MACAKYNPFAACANRTHHGKVRSRTGSAHANSSPSRHWLPLNSGEIGSKSVCASWLNLADSSARKLSLERLESRLALSGQAITPTDVTGLLNRAAAASSATDAIIAVVDRSGNILGVRVEKNVPISIADATTLDFAIDGAVSLARTGAFFANSQAPLTSRTVRFISQSTITQREVESSPESTDPTHNGPGYVAPIGVGNHFPPGVTNAPQVDLFGIEQTNRGINIPNSALAAGAALPNTEAFAQVTGFDPAAQSRGIATLPGGIPLYKNGVLVGGIGVFFPGPARLCDL